MSNGPRPLLLGYIRASALQSPTDLRRVEVELEAFADRERFSLGPLFVEKGGAPGAFHALMDELARNESARGVLIPDQRHMTSDEQIVLSRHEEGGARAPVLAVHPAPLAGGPGAASPVCAGSALPSRPHRALRKIA